MTRVLLIIGLLMGGLSLAQANVYSCVVNGEKVYTNKKSSQCREEKLDKLGSYSSDKTSLYRARRNDGERTSSTNTPRNNRTTTANNAASTSSTNTAASNTTSAMPAQAQRDQGRRDILLNELNNEKKALAQARLALTNGRLIRNPSTERKQQSLASLQRAVEDRQQNIQALQNELSRM